MSTISDTEVAAFARRLRVHAGVVRLDGRETDWRILRVNTRSFRAYRVGESAKLSCRFGPFSVSLNEELHVLARILAFEEKFPSA